MWWKGTAFLWWLLSQRVFSIVFPGVNPYPGIQVDANFYKLIQNGFKMDRPYYATKDM